MSSPSPHLNLNYNENVPKRPCILPGGLPLVLRPRGFPPPQEGETAADADRTIECKETDEDQTRSVWRAGTHPAKRYAVHTPHHSKPASTLPAPLPHTPPPPPDAQPCCGARGGWRQGGRFVPRRSKKQYGVQ
eukprot:gene10402-biopygen3294